MGIYKKGKDNNYDLLILNNLGFKIKETSKKISLVGVIKLNHSYETEDMFYFVTNEEFKIEITIFKKKLKLPQVFELSNRIPSKYHKYSNEELCLGYPLDIWSIYSNNKSLFLFINLYVIPYFFRFCCIEKYGHAPVGEYSHSDGTIEYFKDLLNIDKKHIIFSILELYILNKNVSCPCGSGKEFKKCHFDQINKLEFVPREVLRNILKKLK